MEELIVLANMIKNLDSDLQDVYINFIDRANQKNVGIFQHEQPAINAVGGPQNKGYSIKPVRIILRYNEDSIDSYGKAIKIHKMLKEYPLDSNPPIRYFNLLDEEPIFLGRGGVGEAYVAGGNVVEYTIRVDILVTI